MVGSPLYDMYFLFLLYVGDLAQLVHRHGHLWLELSNAMLTLTWLIYMKRKWALVKWTREDGYTTRRMISWLRLISYCQGNCGKMLDDHEIIPNFPLTKILTKSIPIRISFFSWNSYLNWIQTVVKLVTLMRTMCVFFATRVVRWLIIPMCFVRKLRWFGTCSHHLIWRGCLRGSIKIFCSDQLTIKGRWVTGYLTREVIWAV